jgi:methionine-rich copper-binding protein CopC
MSSNLVMSTVSPRRNIERNSWWSARIVSLAVVTAAVTLVCAPPASAHDVLESSVPATDSAIAAAPAQVSLRFDEPVAEGFTELVVLGPDGASHWEGGGVTVSGAQVSAPLKPLGPAGKYTVKYHVVSADGHPVSGTVPFTLTVAGPAASRPAAAAVSSSAVAAPVAAAVPAQDPGTVPLWPWIAGGVVLVLAGAIIANRIVGGRSASSGQRK